MFNERLRRSTLSASKVAEFFLLGKNQQDDWCPNCFIQQKDMRGIFRTKLRRLATPI